eukprot:5583754-Alexandrium_andersonii.AAC.1
MLRAAQGRVPRIWASRQGGAAMPPCWAHGHAQLRNPCLRVRWIGHDWKARQGCAVWGARSLRAWGGEPSSGRARRCESHCR